MDTYNKIFLVLVIVVVVPLGIFYSAKLLYSSADYNFTKPAPQIDIIDNLSESLRNKTISEKPKTIADNENQTKVNISNATQKIPAISNISTKSEIDTKNEIDILLCSGTCKFLLKQGVYTLSTEGKNHTLKLFLDVVPRIVATLDNITNSYRTNVIYNVSSVIFMFSKVFMLKESYIEFVLNPQKLVLEDGKNMEINDTEMRDTNAVFWGNTSEGVTDIVISGPLTNAMLKIVSKGSVYDRIGIEHEYNQTVKIQYGTATNILHFNYRLNVSDNYLWGEEIKLFGKTYLIGEESKYNENIKKLVLKGGY